MVKLFQNNVQSLDSVVMANDRQIGDGAAMLFSVSDLTNFGAKAEDGTPFRRFIWRQWLDVQNNALKPEQRLHPNASISVLADERDQSYTVSGIAVPSKKTRDGFEVVAFAVSDVVYAQNGKFQSESYLKPWYLPTTKKGLENARLTLNEKPTLIEFLLTSSAMQMKAAAGDDPFLFCDSQCSPETLALMKRDPNFIVFLRHVRVPDLTASGKDLEKPAGIVTTYVRVNESNRQGMDKFVAGQIIADYFVSGFGTEMDNPLMERALRQVDRRTIGGLFRYDGIQAAQK